MDGHLRGYSRDSYPSAQGCHDSRRRRISQEENCDEGIFSSMAGRVRFELTLSCSQSTRVNQATLPPKVGAGRFRALLISTIILYIISLPLSRDYFSERVTTIFLYFTLFTPCRKRWQTSLRSFLGKLLNMVAISLKIEIRPSLLTL